MRCRDHGRTYCPASKCVAERRKKKPRPTDVPVLTSIYDD